MGYYVDAVSGQERELTAFTDLGQVDCTGNYWGLGLSELGTLPDKLTLSRPDAVDYSGQVGSQLNGCGPQ